MLTRRRSLLLLKTDGFGDTGVGVGDSGDMRWVQGGAERIREEAQRKGWSVPPAKVGVQFR